MIFCCNNLNKDKEQKNPKNNEQNVNNKSFYINNYFKYKWIEFHNQKTQNDWMNFLRKDLIMWCQLGLILDLRTHTSW